MSSILKALKQLERDHADADPASRPLVEPADGTESPPPAALRRRRQRWIRGVAGVAGVSAAVVGGALLGAVLDPAPPDGSEAGEVISPAAGVVDSSVLPSRDGALQAVGSVPERMERVASRQPPVAVESVRPDSVEPRELPGSAPGPTSARAELASAQGLALAPDPVVLDPVVLDPVVLDPVVLDSVVLDPVVPDRVAPAPEAALSPVVPARALAASSPAVKRRPASEPAAVVDPRGAATIAALEPVVDAETAKTPLPGLDSTRWHPSPERREAQVRVAGRRRSVSQGEVVSGYRVLDITPSAIVFEREGGTFRVRVGDR